MDKNHHQDTLEYLLKRSNLILVLSPSWKKRQRHILGIMLIAIAMLMTFNNNPSFLIQNTTTNNKKKLLQQRNNNNNPYKRTIYGHLHMAKTAGTTLNGEMALTYQRICGNKGFTNELRAWYIKQQAIFSNTDFVQDCDWISPELPYNFWNMFDADLNHESIALSNTQLELHVPCRDPISHLMSVVNHEGGIFHCDATYNEDAVIQQLNPYVLYVKGRFHYDILSSKSNFRLKCFDYQNHLEYVQYMKDYLRPISSSSSSSSSAVSSLSQTQQQQQQHQEEESYQFRPTNDPRNIENECIWKNKELMNFVKQYLIENFDYYKYCQECIGSSDDLFSTY